MVRHGELIPAPQAVGRIEPLPAVAQRCRFWPRAGVSWHELPHSGGLRTRILPTVGEPSPMQPAQTLFRFLQYSVPNVEAALAQGQAPHFQPALPTWYDAFFTLCDRL